MKLAIASWSFILFLLFLLVIFRESEPRKAIKNMLLKGGHDLLQLPTHGVSKMDYMGPETHVFFKIKDIKVGKKLSIYFPIKDLSTSPKLLPREKSEKIPFSSNQLQSVIEFFSFPKHSPQAKAIRYTLQHCELEPIKGETKFCATSLESLLDFVRSKFGSETKFKALTTTHVTNHKILVQNYTILGLKEVSAQKMIACHTMPYPYAIFYCHSQVSENRLFEASLDGEDGERIEATVVCHMDTSEWDKDHVSFRVLKVQPGSSSVCHFLPSDNLVWVPLVPPV